MLPFFLRGLVQRQINIQSLVCLQKFDFYYGFQPCNLWVWFGFEGYYQFQGCQFGSLVDALRFLAFLNLDRNRNRNRNHKPQSTTAKPQHRIPGSAQEINFLCKKKSHNNKGGTEGRKLYNFNIWYFPEKKKKKSKILSGC